jgi:hypothetical protein
MKRESYLLTVHVPTDVPLRSTLARGLKRMLRGYGIVCTDIVLLPTPPESTAASQTSPQTAQDASDRSGRWTHPNPVRAIAHARNDAESSRAD